MRMADGTVWGDHGSWQTKVLGMLSSAPMGLSLIFVTSELKMRIPSKTQSSPDR
jgi:hypothetical protein